MQPSESLGLAPRIWAVGALCRAVADVLDSRFNPVAVRGEISGFTRAASGHCYFTLKDASGQLRCAMFKRAAQMLDFRPVDGELVEIKGRLGVYEPRGELQMVVEHMRRAGQGAWFEQFLKLKAKLEAEGLFDAERKRPLKTMPRGIGVVTSLGAAALHDVATALQRRVPHIPVVLAPSLVQGPDAPPTLVQALQQLSQQPNIDVILLVRGGGSIEDLWSFNDEALAYTIAKSPIQIISGVGHETDFTIADFVADLRAPTPTGAAELAAPRRDQMLQELDAIMQALTQRITQRIEREAQTLDQLALRLSHALPNPDRMREQIQGWQQRLNQAWAVRMENWKRNQAHYQSQLEMLNPQRTLERGYAVILSKEKDQLHAVRKPGEFNTEQAYEIKMAEGQVEVQFSEVLRK